MALDCDGVDDEIGHGDINAIDGTASLTIAFWLQYFTDESLSGFFYKGAINSETFLMRRHNTTATSLEFGATSAGPESGRTATGVLAVNEWAYWTCVYDGAGAANADKIKIYKNGVDQVLTFTGVIPATLGSNVQSLLFGRNGNGLVFSDCQVANAKIWTAVLTAAEIEQEMNSYRPMRTANLVLWAPYNDGTKAVDYSGSGNHGTVTGALAADGPYVGGGVPVRRL